MRVFRVNDDVITRLYQEEETNVPVVQMMI